MKLALSCACCGGTDFDLDNLELREIWNESYIMYEGNKGNKVICLKCGLEDYMENLTPKVEL